MLEEQVKVVAVDGATAWVEPIASAGCGGCTQQCASSSLQKHFGRRRAPLAVDCPMTVSPGDHLVIGVSEGALLWGSLLVYVLPLCGLLVGAGSVQSLAAAIGVAADWPALLGGVMGLTAGFGVVKMLPRFGANVLRPVVLRKILP